MRRAAIFRRPLLLTDAVYHKKASQKKSGEGLFEKVPRLFVRSPIQVFPEKPTYSPLPCRGMAVPNQAVISGRRLVNCIIRTAA